MDSTALSELEAAFASLTREIPTGRWVLAVETMDSNDQETYLHCLQPPGQSIWDGLGLLAHFRAFLQSQIRSMED